MESSIIHDDICVLFITGTAATVRGLPDLAQAQRMWTEWESQQDEIISRVQKYGRRRVRNSLPGDSSPGNVISTAADTPFSGAVSDDGVERGRGDEPAAAVIVKGHMRISGSTKQIPFSNLFCRTIKDAKFQRKGQQLERRLRRTLGRSKEGMRYQSAGLSSKNRDIDKSSFVSNVLLRARLARPCSYCHVPYHHRYFLFNYFIEAIFFSCSNMTLLCVISQACSVYEYEIGVSWTITCLIYYS